MTCSRFRSFSLGLALGTLWTLGSVGAVFAGEPAQWLTFEGYAPEGYGRHIVFVSGDEEYRSEESLPMLAKLMAVRHGFKCTVLFAQDPQKPGIINPQVLDHIPGLEALRTADLMVIATRFRALPNEQMQEIDDYLMSGRPVVGLRTANHGFRFPEDSKWHHYSWRYNGEKTEWAEGFGGLVLGSWYFSHHGWHKYESTRGLVEKGAEKHEILRGIEPKSVWGPTDVYGVKEPIPGVDVQILLRGQVLAGMKPDDEPIGKGPYEKAPDYVKEGSNDKNDPMQALAWTKSYQLPGGRKGRAFCTTMGSSTDLVAEGARRLVVNAIFWCLGMEVLGKTDVAFVDAYEPTEYVTHKREYWETLQLKVSDFDLKTPLQEPVEKVQGPVSNPYLDVRGGREGHGYEFAGHPVNRQRLYNFYARQAEHYLDGAEVPAVVPHYPDLDAGTFGHWGLYHKNGYRDRRWNLMDVGSVMGGILRVGKQTLPRAIAVKLSDGMSCAFDPETLRFTHVWKGGFVKFQPNRWGIGQGTTPDGEVIETGVPVVGWSRADHPEKTYPPGKAQFLGYYRVDQQVVFHFRIDGTEFWESPVNIDGQFAREVEIGDPNDGKRWTATSPGAAMFGAELRDLAVRGGDASYAEKSITLPGKVGERIPGSPFAIDRIPVPHHNEFGAMFLIGDHDFFSNGDAAVCTMMGDVWRVSGLDENLNNVTWTRIATGLSQALGLEVFKDRIHVACRDRVWRLHDLNGDGEIDHYENFCDDFEVSTGGHDFSVGLERDTNGYFYFVSGKSGVMRISPDGSTAESIATGLRNTNGIGASSTIGGLVTTSTNEGDWTPASAVFEVRDGDFYGRRATKDGSPIAPALCYLPRGLDNSSGGQVFASSKQWGALNGQLFHFSFGNGSWMMILRDEDGEGKQRTQGAAVPLPGDFESGAHRGAFSPVDGQLYVTGADGWGNYAISDGDFARIRYAGDEHLHLPIGWKAYANGIEVEFAKKIDPESAAPDRSFCQTWNYQYSDAYGSMEYSVKQQGLPGHDALMVKSVRVNDEDERKVFFEIPDLQPAMQAQLYARLKSADGEEFVLDMYPTLLRLGGKFPDAPAADPAKITQLTLPVRWPVPFKPKVDTGKETGRRVSVQAIPGLLYDVTEIKAKPGERLTLEFKNTDTIPHNWVLVKAGKLQDIGMASNNMLANPKAAELHYVPESDDVLHYTPMLYHNQRHSLNLNVPDEPGRYPYLCTFPGHWAVMKGELLVE
jgi:azurin